MLCVTAALLWYSFQSIEVGEGETKLGFIMKVWSSANKPFLLLSGLAAIASHGIRAERWKLLLNPLGYNVTFKNSFLSVMVSYFINLIIPRGGELSRCYNMYKLEKVPVDVSLGTVVSERIIDLFFLIVFIGLSFFIELENLRYFFSTVDFGKKDIGDSFNMMYLWIVAGGLVLLLLGAYLFFQKKRKLALQLFVKLKSLLRGLRQGLLAVFKLKKKKTFIAYSFIIWFLYYMMFYLVMIAFPETETLGLFAALTMFVIGGIAMTMPLPGGAGSMHVLVPAGLVLLYGMAQEQALAFTVIFHGWQTLVVIVVGAISLLLSQTKYKKTT